MGRDKGSIVYHAEPQALHCVHLLENFCARVFVSLRKKQSVLPVYQGVPVILDASVDEKAGPMRGILAALREHPRQAWLVLACDLPFVDRSTLQDLVIRRNPQRMATAFYNPQTESPEPMCAIYEPLILPSVERAFSQERLCPRKMLKKADIEVLNIDQPGRLNNINTPQEFDAAHQAGDLLRGGF